MMMTMRVLTEWVASSSPANATVTILAMMKEYFIMMLAAILTK